MMMMMMIIDGRNSLKMTPLKFFTPSLLSSSPRKGEKK